MPRPRWAAPSRTAYASLATDNGSELYTIDLQSGATTLLGPIAGSPVHSITLRP